MKTILSSMIAAALLSVAFASAAQAAEEKFTFDPNHTNIYWSASHFGFSSPSGKFSKTEGTLTLDEAKPENSSVKMTIYTGTVVTGIDKFDAHLKSDAFFDAEKFPTATFISDKVEVTGKNTAKVSGNLTLHGVTQPVTLDVTLNKIGDSPMTKKKVAGFSAGASLKRSDFGINFGLPGVSDEVKITIEAEATLP